MLQAFVLCATLLAWRTAYVHSYKASLWGLSTVVVFISIICCNSIYSAWQFSAVGCGPCPPCRARRRPPHCWQAMAAAAAHMHAGEVVGGVGPLKQARLAATHCSSVKSSLRRCRRATPTGAWWWLCMA